MTFVHERCLMLSVGYCWKIAAGSELLLPPYFRKGQHCIAVPAATTSFLFEKMYRKLRPLVVCFFFFPERYEKREYPYYFSARKYQTCSLHKTSCGYGTYRWVCVCVHVHYQWLFLLEDSVLTPDLLCSELKSIFLNSLYIQASDLQLLSIIWQPLASQSIIGWVLHTSRSSFILRREYLNRQHRVLHNTIKSLFYRWNIHIYYRAILIENMLPQKQ